MEAHPTMNANKVRLVKFRNQSVRFRNQIVGYRNQPIEIKNQFIITFPNNFKNLTYM